MGRGQGTVYICNEPVDIERCTYAMSQRTWNSVLLQWGRGHGTVYFCNGAENMEQCTFAMRQRTRNGVLLQWDRGKRTVYLCNGTEDREWWQKQITPWTNISSLQLKLEHFISSNSTLYNRNIYSSHLQLLHFADGIVHAKAWLQPRNTHTNISHLECQSFILKIIERN